MLEKAIQTTQRDSYTHVQYARFADDMVILIDSQRKAKSLIWQTEEVSRSWVLNIAASWDVTRSGDRTTRRD